MKCALSSVVVLEVCLYRTKSFPGETKYCRRSSKCLICRLMLFGLVLTFFAEVTRDLKLPYFLY